MRVASSTTPERGEPVHLLERPHRLLGQWAEHAIGTAGPVPLRLEAELQVGDAGTARAHADHRDVVAWDDREHAVAVATRHAAQLRDDAAGFQHADRAAQERRRAEREHATVFGDEPVARTTRRRRHPDDGCVEAHAAGRTVERRGAEGEHAAVHGDEPVARAVRGRCHRHDGCVQADATGRAVEAGVTEREHAAVLRDEPVAVAGRGRDEIGDRRREPNGSETAVVLRGAERIRPRRRP